MKLTCGDDEDDDDDYDDDAEQRAVLIGNGLLGPTGGKSHYRF